MGPQRGVFALALIAAAGAGVPAAGCGDDDGGERARRPTAPAKPRLLEGRPIRPGTYVSGFRPQLRLTFTDARWGLGRDFPDGLALGYPTPGQPPLLEFLRPSEVFDPRATDTLRPAPDDLLAWLRRHPNLRVVDSEPFAVGNRRGTLLDARAREDARYPDCDGECRNLLPGGQAGRRARPLFVLPGEELKLGVLEGAQQIVVAIIPSDEDSEAFYAAAKKLLATVEFV